MTDKELVTRTLAAFASSVHESDEDIVSELCATGVSRLLAERLVALVPLAFGRVLLAHLEPMEFPMSAVLMTQDGSPKSCDLTTDQTFISALELATTMFHEGPRDLFQAAATVSAEVAAASELLHSGATLAGVRFTEPMFLRLSYEEWTSPEAQS